MNDHTASTESYEAWLGEQMPLIADDLAAKHDEMAGDELRFLRGSYYQWLVDVARQVPRLLDGPSVACVGDLHVENFGTWTDATGKRRWGVNDFDELGWGAYALDLARLATSAVITPHVTLSNEEICSTLLATWRTARPRAAVDLTTPAARHLARLVPPSKPAKRYYAELAASRAVAARAIPAAVQHAVAATVGPAWSPTWHLRRAGTGSLGHPRYAAVDRQRAREAKLLGPPTAVWAATQLDPAIAAALPVDDTLLLGRVLHAIHGPDPLRRAAGWQIRRLGPDAVRIEISRLDPKHAARVLRSMARAIVDVAGCQPERLAAARNHERRRAPSWLHQAAQTMAAATHDRWKQFRSSDGSARP